MPKTKVENGRTYELINSRWHLKDATEDDVEVRNGRNGKEYRVKGTDQWQPIDDTTQGEIAGRMNANTVNRDAIAGDLRPDKARPDKVKGTQLGGTRADKPWRYDSPMAYIIAYAKSEPKTKIGRYLFSTINTLSWLDAWYKNKHPETPETEAIDSGYKDAVRNIDGWLGNIDPAKDLDKITSKDLGYAYKQVQNKMESLYPKYKQAQGKTDPESIRIKTEYKTYQKFFDKMDSDIKGRKSNEDRQKRFAEASARARQVNMGMNTDLRGHL